MYIKFNNTQVYNKADIFSNTILNLWKKQMIILLMGDLHQHDISKQFAIQLLWCSFPFMLYQKIEKMKYINSETVSKPIKSALQ